MVGSKGGSLTDEPIVEFRDVTKRYGEIVALEDVSFSVQQGEILGYIGPNGAGKTTSLKIIVGLIKDYAGQVVVAGQNPKTDFSTSRRLGYMPQETGFQEWRTVEGALNTFGLLSGMQRGDLSSRITEVLDLVGLPEMGVRKIVHLSGGMQQKLKLAQAILHDPDFIILDEPMNGLDPTSRFQMKGIIRKLAGQGKTVIFSSHILSDVQDIAHTIAILNRGHLLKVDSPDALRSQFQVGHDIEIAVAPGTPLCIGLEALSGIESVTVSSPTKQLVHVSADIDIDATIFSIWENLREQRVRVRNFNLLYPSLEDVYLKYVGGAN